MKELSGHLIKSGKFFHSIDVFIEELDLAHQKGVITLEEQKSLMKEFCLFLLNPSRFEEIQDLGDRMLQLAIRMPDYIDSYQKTFYKNIEEAKNWC